MADYDLEALSLSELKKMQKDVAKEMLNWGSGCPDWSGDEFWHGLPAHLCLPGHPFD